MATLFLAAVIAIHSTGLSQAAPDSTVPTFRAHTRLVLVDVIPEYIKTELHTRAITLATQLKAEDFRVFDKGREVPISSFDVGAEHSTRPIALWLIVQCPERLPAGWHSDFLRGKTELIRRALTHLEQQDAVGVAHWCDNGDASIDLPPGHDPDAALATLDGVLDRLPIQGQNRRGELAMQRMVRLLVENAQQTTPDRLPILLFFYGDHCATYPGEAEKIIKAVLETSGIVFGMSDGSWQIIPAASYNGYGQVNYLVHLYSQETGDQFYTTVDPELFSAAVDYIVSQLHLRYTLGFKPLIIDGKRHKLKVALTEEAQQRFRGIQLRFRQEYVPVAGSVAGFPQRQSNVTFKSDMQPQVPVASLSRQPDVTFKSATRMVALDVVVTDQHGKPIRNLSKDDFAVMEDGERQEIASFETPDQRTPVAFEGHHGSPQAKNVNTQSNIAAEPLTILVFDALDTKIIDQAYARFEINKFLVAHGPRLGQPTALMALEEKRLELLHDYTRDAKELEDALKGYKAHLPFRLMSGMGFTNFYAATDPMEASERFADAILALREIATANVQFAGRKNLIWVGPGFPSLDHVNVAPTDKSRLYIWGRETMDLIAQARLAVYTIDPRGLEVSPEELMTPTLDELAFESIAPLSGGRIFRGLNDLDVQIATSIADGGSYYSIAYYPSNHDWNGHFREIRVTLRNPSFAARTRPGYFAYPETAPSSTQLGTLLSHAVINPLPYHALNIEASAKVSGTERVAKMRVTADAAGLRWEVLPDNKRRCEITLAIAGFSLKGDVVTQALKEFEIVVNEKKYLALTTDGMVMNLSMQIPTTLVRMRVVTRDSTNGNIGTADLTPEGNQFH